jgi:hypothetical protein
MNKKPSDDLFSAIRPLMYVSRVLGLAPFGYIEKKLPGRKIYEEVQQNSAAFIYSTSMVVLILFSFLFSIMFKAITIHPKMAANEAFLDILISATSISSSVSLILSLTKK